MGPAKLRKDPDNQPEKTTSAGPWCPQNHRQPKAGWGWVAALSPTCDLYLAVFNPAQPLPARSGRIFEVTVQRFFMEKIIGEDFLEIIYRPDLDMLVARWPRAIGLPELQRGYELLLAGAIGCGCRRWLLDVRRRLNTHQLGAQWMMSSLLSRLGPQLGGRTRLAYLLAPIYLRAADAAFPPPAYFNGKPFVADRFVEEQAATVWLTIDANADSDAGPNANPATDAMRP